jgi:hypothetical protein
MLSKTLDSAERRLNSKPPSSTQSQLKPMVLSKSGSRRGVVASGWFLYLQRASDELFQTDLWIATIGSTLESLQWLERDPKGS